MLNLTRLHLGIAHESQFQGLGIRSVARLKWRTRELLTCFAAAIRFLPFIGLSRRIMDRIDLVPLTLRFLARAQLLRESTQFFRSAPRLPHDTSYLSCSGPRSRVFFAKSCLVGVAVDKSGEAEVVCCACHSLLHPGKPTVRATKGVTRIG